MLIYQRPVKEDIRKIAKRAFQLLECSGLARIDFFYQDDENKIYLNEINTLPGLQKLVCIHNYVLQMEYLIRN